VPRQLIITADGSHTIAVPELNETYHSLHGAIQESNHVFIKNGLEHWQHITGLAHAKVFEVGFGTGLNALLTFSFSEKHKISISYETIEAHPILAEEALLLNYPDKIDDPLAKIWFEKMHSCPWNRWADISSLGKLKKIHGLLEHFQPDGCIDICYFDAFAPSKQPEMWDVSILEKVTNHITIGGIFVTYSAAGHLKRSLKALGFEVEVPPGPPGKMEMVRATKM